MHTTDLILRHETLLRICSFLTIMFIMWRWEIAFPKRPLNVNKPMRWANNLGLLFLNSLVLRLALPFAGVGMAVWCQQKGWGLFNTLSDGLVPSVVSVTISIIVLDFAVYLQHRVMHQVPLLWRLHRVHHLDLDIDLSTGLRFHPLEILLSMLFKFLVITLLGPSALAVMLFEILLNGSAVFNHSNIAITHRIDAWLRRFIVTPDMHRVHHSTQMHETNSNYGFFLSCWDRLLSTYIAQPEAGHHNMQIGLAEYRDQELTQKLRPLLLSPFRSN